MAARYLSSGSPNSGFDILEIRRAVGLVIVKEARGRFVSRRSICVNVMSNTLRPIVYARVARASGCS